MAGVWVAATQFAASRERAENVAKAEALIRDAAGKGAKVAEAGSAEAVIVAGFDLEKIRAGGRSGAYSATAGQTSTASC